MNPIFDLSIPIFILVALLFLLVFISPTLLATVLGTLLASPIYILDLLHIDEILLVRRNLLLILLVWKTTDGYVRMHHN